MTEHPNLALSVAGAATVLAVLAGLPLAWLLGRHQFRGKSPLQAALLLPLVLPSTLIGYYVLAFARHEPGASLFGRLGIGTVFDWRMVVVIASVGALAIFVRSAQADFARVDPRLEQAARTLGRSEWSIFWAVTLPLAWRGVVAGTALAFCRALGEFALTLLVARALPPSADMATLGLFALTCAGVLAVLASRLTRAVD